MKKSPNLLIIGLLLFFLGGCDPRGAGLPEHIIAQVNEEQIPIEQFDREFKELILESDKDAKGTGLGTLRQVCLDQVIERKILVQEARRLGIKVSPEELNQAIFEIETDYPGEGFGEKLGLKGMTLEEWKVRLEEELLAEKVIRSTLHSQVKIDEKEAFQYYEDHRVLISN